MEWWSPEGPADPRAACPSVSALTFIDDSGSGLHVRLDVHAMTPFVRGRDTRRFMEMRIDESPGSMDRSRSSDRGRPTIDASSILMLGRQNCITHGIT